MQLQELTNQLQEAVATKMQLSDENMKLKQ